MLKKLLTLSIATLPIFGFAQTFTLPALKYANNALEPYIDAQTMEIHHDKHHAGYVNNLNKAIAGTPLEKFAIEDILISAGRRSDAVRNNAGGHYNHSLFWDILSPKAAKEPSGDLMKAIKEQFVSLDSVKTLLNKAASTRFGSGWAWLYVTPGKKLAVCSSPLQDNPIMDISPERGIPILGIDVWEHAYYLKYQNKRGDYLSAIWNVLDWNTVSDNYTKALESPLLKRIEMDMWSEIKAFHLVMAQTFHPSEEGNFKPIRERSQEMSDKANALLNSAIPASYNTAAVKTTLKNLATEAASLNKLVKKKKSDEVLKKALSDLHDRFHEVMEGCGM